VEKANYRSPENLGLSEGNIQRDPEAFSKIVYRERRFCEGKKPDYAVNGKGEYAQGYQEACGENDLFSRIHLIACLLSCFYFPDCLNQCGQYFHGIPHNAILGCFEYWGILVRVDGHDILGGANTSQMLCGSGNSNCNVQVGSNDLSGLSGVLFMPAPTLIRNRAGTSCGCSEKLRQLNQGTPIVR
jgi:hypothetical protein